MKLNLTYIFMIIIAGGFTACYDDLGNYDYHTLEEPVVTGVQDSVFTAFVGDSLYIRPEFSHSRSNEDIFSFYWSIQVPYELREVEYEGRALNIAFGFRPGEYSCRLRVVNTTNSLEYFYYFQINAVTEFTQGTVVLSDEGGQGKLAFIKPDGTLVNDLYQKLNDDLLPTSPFQLIGVSESYQPGNIKTYWILGKGGEKPGVILDANSMFRNQYVNDNFFVEPPSIEVGRLHTQLNGTVSGLINEQLYQGTSSTAPFAPDYGKFGNGASGNYKLAPSYLVGSFSNMIQYYIGFDTNDQQFVWFNAQGNYSGINYQIDSVGPGFDPRTPNIEVSNMLYISSESSYAYGTDTDGVFTELKFKFSTTPEPLFTSFYSRPFIRPDLIDETSKWIGNQQGIIYFTSNDKVYRYNPINEEVKVLSADFEGKTVTMIEFVPGTDQLVAGVEGALFYLDIGTGKDGNVIKTMNGIQGSPIDVFIRP